MPRTRRSLYAKDYKALLQQLCDQRERGGVTQVELAKKMGTSQSMLSKLERGVVRMDLMDLLSYLRSIDADPIEFVREYLNAIDWALPSNQKIRLRRLS